MELKKASLYFAEKNSNKEYHAELAASGGGFVVNFRYGRRGGALQGGSKTPSPVDYAKAEKIYNKLIAEKTGKGYTPDESGTSYQGTENAGRKTGFVPQLCNAISEAEARKLIEDDDYAAQEKMNGERRLVRVGDDCVHGINRKGLIVPLPESLASEVIAVVCDGFTLDGEIIGEILHIFDIIGSRGDNERGWIQRIGDTGILSNLDNVKIIPVAETTEAKRDLFDRVKAENGEGLVFKRKDAPVTPGKPNSGGDWLKFKFIESCSAIVSKVNEGKRSVAVELRDDSGAIVPVGNVTITPNYPIPAPGDVVEVEYLYAYKGGSLYQPVYRGKRTDIDEDACSVGQLKYKPEAAA